MKNFDTIQTNLTPRFIQTMGDQKQINESLYSRQLYVLGHETMRKMADSNVLIIGLGGLGVEVAKNVILTGVKSVTLYDDQPCTEADLSSQFYLRQEDIGKRTRAEASAQYLADLNQYVPVTVMAQTINQDDFSKFSVVVLTDQRSLKSVITFNEWCRKANCKFILAEQRGLSGFIFVDCGQEHVVSDTNGEAATSNLISTIQTGNPTIITVDDSARLNLDDGGGNPDRADRVTFTEVDGTDGLPGMNDFAPQRVKITGPYTLELVDLDTTGMGTHKMGSGYLHQVKPTVKMSFSSLAESLEKPEFLVTDFSKMDTLQLHLLMQATYQFAETHEGKLPTPAEFDQLFSLMTQINEGKDEKSATKVEKLDAELLKALGRTIPGTLQPLTAALGGIVSQEVLKACSGKFTPIRQWCYLDVRELLITGKADKPEEFTYVHPTDADLAPVGDRYDGLRMAVGSPLVDKLRQSSTFLVGAGAVGCEIIKNLVMMGVATNGGTLHVTDMDSIETSNLSRQFLYRNTDVEKPKSDTAATAVRVFNPEANIKSYQMRVGQETEETFNDEFYRSLDFVTNALDNVQARLYMDSMCVYYKLPLLESGTLGLKGNTQIVVPSITESYGSSRDPPEKSIPQCLLHHFPNRIEHTIQWARDQFDGDFTMLPQQINSFLDDPEGFIKNLRSQPGYGKVEQLQSIRQALIDQRPTTFEDCVRWALLQMETNFNHKIQQLLFNFPLDQVTSQGTPFWSGPKRAPTPLSYHDKAVRDLAVDFILSAAMLRAEVFQLKDRPTVRDQALKDRVIDIADQVEIPKFTPQRGVKIQTTEEESPEEKTTEIDDDREFEEVVKLLMPKCTGMSKLTSLEFEKDDETNWHMDFVTACSNLRASNYKISLADMHQTKLIAGKIIPAMITTTAMVSGLICVELLKVLSHRQNERTIEHYRNAFCNLALPFIGISEPIAPKKTKVRDDWEWNLWDEFLLDQGKPMTLSQLIDHFSEAYQLEVSMLSSGVSLVYSFFMNKDKKNQRMNQELSEIVKEMTKKSLPVNKDHLVFEVTCTREEDDEDVDVPPIKYRFKNFASTKA